MTELVGATFPFFAAGFAVAFAVLMNTFRCWCIAEKTTGVYRDILTIKQVKISNLQNLCKKEYV